ncbi:MAG: nuclear transport factor 2 family protein [Pyrinomonadaceae bacterium]
MKKLIVGVCFLVLLAACQPVANENTANANKTPETKAVAPPSEADIIAKEKAAWDAFKRKDADAFKKLLASDYLGISGSGVTDVTATVAAMNDVALSDLTFADWKMTQIDKDLVLLTYTTTQKGTYKGEAFPEGPYRHAAAWINRNGEWLGIYFQETAVSKVPPPPPPASKPTAATASPAASPAKVETSDDVIANEKLVWDLFRTKNFEAFQTLLAPEFMEIEPTGVYDKVGSVKELSQMDASQFEQGDWKAVKFDDDAALVTYTVTMKGPKPEKYYHATIWAKRDGKWLGFHHQGTPAAPAPGASPSPVKEDVKKKM